MSMGGLAVAIGLVIDDAVVVVENIHRRAGGGRDSVVDAVSQLMAPLVSSTLTTVVVFAPLGLLSGVVGPVLPRAVDEPVGGRADVAVPVDHASCRCWRDGRCAAIAAARPARSRPKAGCSACTARCARRDGRPSDGRRRRRRRARGRDRRRCSSSIGTGFLPPADEGGFVVDYLTPAGSALEETDRQVRRMEQVIADTPEVAAYSRRTGSELGPVCHGAEHRRHPGPAEAARRARSHVRGDHLATCGRSCRRPRRSPRSSSSSCCRTCSAIWKGSPTPIEIKIFGDDPEKLEELAEPVEEMLEKIDGVVDVVGMQRGNPEVTWDIDPVASGRARPDASSRSPTRWRQRGSATWRPSCGCSTAAFRCASVCPMRCASTRRGCRHA